MLRASTHKRVAGTLAGAVRDSTRAHPSLRHERLKRSNIQPEAHVHQLVNGPTPEAVDSTLSHSLCICHVAGDHVLPWAPGPCSGMSFAGTMRPQGMQGGGASTVSSTSSRKAFTARMEFQRTSEGL